MSKRPDSLSRGRPFQKGASGNPGGRPKVAHLRELARSYTHIAMDTLVEIASNKKAPPGARVSAAGAILDRGYGRPASSLPLIESAVGQEANDLEVARRIAYFIEVLERNEQEAAICQAEDDALVLDASTAR